jgi:hypothetical protein
MDGGGLRRASRDGSGGGGTGRAKSAKRCLPHAAATDSFSSSLSLSLASASSSSSAFRSSPLLSPSASSELAAAALRAGFDDVPVEEEEEADERALEDAPASSASASERLSGETSASTSCWMISSFLPAGFRPTYNRMKGVHPTRHARRQTPYRAPWPPCGAVAASTLSTCKRSTLSSDSENGRARQLPPLRCRSCTHRFFRPGDEPHHGG